MTNFINCHPVKIPKEIEEFLNKEADWLTILRVGATLKRIYVGRKNDCDLIAGYLKGANQNGLVKEGDFVCQI
jgi:hypothetical protein